MQTFKQEFNFFFDFRNISIYTFFKSGIKKITNIFGAIKIRNPFNSFAQEAIVYDQAMT